MLVYSSFTYLRSIALTAPFSAGGLDALDKSVGLGSVLPEVLIDVLDGVLESGLAISCFVKTFLKLCGITPMEYREQLRNAMNRIPEEKA